ncbi:MAG: hypothetical protein LBS32_06355 [Clostridiales Family XIII bacterium]|nr:hypothetical protein [Clostridiales Family XIII bacterium]
MENSRFLQKNGITIRRIARDLLALSEGDSMTTISEYEKTFSCSRWTIQRAIQFLLNNQCMNIEKRGPKGTFVYDLNHDLLYEHADWKPLLGLAPIPSSLIHGALFTGFAEAINHTNLPLNLGFMVPASVRFALLSNGRCHFIVTSRLASKIYAEKYPNISVALELEGARYCTPYRLCTMRGDIESIEDGLCVGIYDAAIEQSYITELLCKGKKVTRKHENYHNCLKMLANGEIDVLVQRGDIVEDPLPACFSISISIPELDSDVITPVILVNSDNYGMARLLESAIDTKIIADVQSSVISGNRRVSYY